MSHTTSEPRAAARQHLWGHFTVPGADVPMITRGEGVYVWNDKGDRMLDALASLFCVNVGYGRHEILEKAVKETRDLPYFSNWNFVHPVAARLAERITNLAPAGLDRVFFTSGGTESVESAIKLARQYHKVTGNPDKYKVIARRNSYHGTSLGALMATGIEAMKAPFEPVAPGGCHVPSTRAPRDGTTIDFADTIAQRIAAEGPDTVAAVILEPVQSAGGCLTPPEDYFARVSKICRDNNVLLISDEVICGFGRLGQWFGAQVFGYEPDIITTAKGITSGYAPMGAVIINNRISDAFERTGTAFAHGYTFGAHPLACAVADANLDIIEREKLVGHVAENGPHMRAMLETLQAAHPMVKDVRGIGYFHALELGPHDGDGELDAEQSGAVVRELSAAILRRGVFCRVENRAGYPALLLSPPFVATTDHLAEIHDAIDGALTETRANGIYVGPTGTPI